MYCTPRLYDSGISMGSNLSKDNATPSSHSLPGFMEDEPLQCDSGNLNDSSINTPSVSDPGKRKIIFIPKLTPCSCLDIVNLLEFIDKDWLK